MAAFIDLYSGPEFQIHWKYAYMLTVVYITFLFGPGLPILFPIALGSLVFLFTVERLLLAYSYRKPPMYDDTMNAAALNLLMLSPIGYILSSAYMYSNQQVF